MNDHRAFVGVTVVVMALLYGLHALVSPDLGERNLEIFTEMVYSKANESFDTSDSLPGGRTQQPLIAGVVARGLLPFGYGPGPEEAQRAGAELVNPFDSADEASVEEGRELYGIYCTLCHDGAGNGQGSVVDHGMARPPSLHAVRALQMADGEMFHILTVGQGNMAPYAAQMTPEERWKAILYVRRLQETNR